MTTTPTSVLTATAPPFRLTRFEPAHAERVLGWAQTKAELSDWCARDDHPLTDPRVFDAWHEDPDVSAFVLLLADEPVAYGETWFDDSDHTAELARLIVAPRRRRRGFAGYLIEHLCEHVRRAMFDHALLRVTPSNVAAQDCYRKAGFLRLPTNEQARFNDGERVPWVWMRRKA